MAFRGTRLEYPHQPVLVREVVKYLVTQTGGIYVDGTVGSGGHSAAVGERLIGKGRLICLDRDPEAVRLSGKRLAFLGSNVCVIKANFANLDNVLKNLEIKEVQGVLLDLGVSSYQIEKSGRGFSFSRNEPLDMRMDPDETLTADSLVNNLSSKELERLLKDFGEERRAKLIARAVVSERSRKPINTSSRLAVLTESVFPPPSRGSKARHPATKTFQALRIAVNKELENLEIFLKKIPLLMAKGGRLVVLSYHSLEDRLVKQAMFEWEKGCTCPPDFPECICGKTPVFRRLIKKGVKPGQEEIEYNPRSRSARLRVAERL
jgi:16S rRNA (cytosine1402-N4)-methyltransferase